MKYNHTLVGILCLVSVLLGVVGTIAIKKLSDLKIDPTISFEINPLEPLVLLITLFVGYYVARTIAKNNDTELTRKQLTIDRFNSFDQLITREVHKVIQPGDIEFTSVNMKCKALRSRINSLINFTVRNNYFKSNDQDIIAVNSSIRDLWEIMTDSSKEGVSVENGKVRYTELVKQEIDTKLIQIQEKILTLIYRIK